MIIFDMFRNLFTIFLLGFGLLYMNIPINLGFTYFHFSDSVLWFGFENQMRYVLGGVICAAGVMMFISNFA